MTLQEEYNDFMQRNRSGAEILDKYIYIREHSTSNALTLIAVVDLFLQQDRSELEKLIKQGEERLGINGPRTKSSGNGTAPVAERVS